MKPEQILSHAPKVLSQEQREFYFQHGYLQLESFIGPNWLDRLWTVTDRLIAESRSLGTSNKVFDLEPTHTADNPRLRRISQPVQLDPVFEEFGLRGPIVDLAEDLVGPDVKFHHSKLNMKWSGGGEEVKWHQDIQFWPHTNYDVLTLGVYLEAVDGDMAPMGVVPRSHQGPLYELYDENDNWTGFIRDQDLPAVDLEAASYIVGQAGTVTVHNCRSIHGSAPNRSDRVRPLLLSTYSAADAFPITTLTLGASHSEEIIRGQPARWARFDSRPCPMPPDWSKPGGYKSIFAHQKREAS